MPKTTKAQDQEVAEETAVAETKPETIEVSKEKLDGVLDRLDKLERENEILRDSVSRGRLEEAEEKRKDKELPRAYLKVFKGKVVTAWNATEAKIVHNPTTGMPVGEVLQAVYIFLDGTNSGPVEQVEFTRAEEREHVRIIEKVAVDTVRVQFENPKLPQEPFDINLDFLNP